MDPSADVLRVEIPEWGSITIPDLSLSDQDYRLIKELSEQTHRVEIDELKSGLRIQAKSWVGLIRFEHLELSVVPKLAGNQLGLVQMLAFAFGLKSLNPLKAARDLHVIEQGELFDLIGLLFAKECERVVQKGLMQDYVTREDELKVLRGRLIIFKQVRQHMGRVDKLECCFDEHSNDVVENQLLATALLVCSKIVRDPKVRRMIRQLYTLFISICDPANMDLKQVWQTLEYNRQNQHYREAHQIARIILEGMGIENLFSARNLRSFAFLINMNNVFELFLYKYLKSILPRDIYSIDYQHQNRMVIWDVFRNRSYTKIIPDILIRSGDENLVMDVKYKLYDTKKVSNSDIYQCFLYSYAYQYQDKLPSSVLIFPIESGSTQTQALQISGNKVFRGARIHLLGVNIPKVLENIQYHEHTIENRLIPFIEQLFQKATFADSLIK
jgi:5-methylcytosine-specific restriction enzyme subunit McrC